MILSQDIDIFFGQRVMESQGFKGNYFQMSEKMCFPFILLLLLSLEFWLLTPAFCYFRHLIRWLVNNLPTSRWQTRIIS